MPCPHIQSRLDRATGLGGHKSQTVVEEEWEQELSLQEGCWELRAEGSVSCPFGTLQTMCHKVQSFKDRDSTLSICSKKRMFLLFSYNGRPLFIFKQNLNRCRSLHYRMDRNFKRRGNWS